MVMGKSILVVDDDAAVRQSCRRVLTERGHRVEAVASGREGLERARYGSFDCALVDLKMPDMDGMEIVRVIRRDRANMVLVIITGYGSVDTAAEAMRLGVADYIGKPFTPEEVAGAVEQAMTAPPLAVRNDLGRALTELARAAPKPEHFEHRSPPAVAQMVAEAVGVGKARLPLLNTVILGVLAGVYIGFGAALATLVSYDAPSRFGVGVGSVLTGAAFSVGLILVVVGGAELFTGNNLMVASVWARRLGGRRLLARWAVVYAANFLGGVLLAGLTYYSGLWKAANGGIADRAVAIAAAKVELSFVEAFVRGVGCNWLVCLAVWMALSAKDIAGKVLVIFFPIMAFVALGYEHCVANMYFVPMGLLLKGVSAAGQAGVELTSLTWGRFLTGNLLPVTVGNIVGGALFVGSAYWWAYARGRRSRAGAGRP